MARVPFWLKAVLLAIPGVLLLISFVFVVIGWYVSRNMGFSGGELRPVMADYDVRHYDLAVTVDPTEESIHGRNTVTVEALADMGVFEIHLDDRLDVTSVSVDGVRVDHRHRDGLVAVELASVWRTGSRHRIAVVYEGQPKEAIRAPWIDGFVWSETPSGEPWIGVTSEGSGGDIWWPCKDHPSDEPDEGMDIALTVPGHLVGLANGRHVGTATNPDGTVTSRWRVGYPINNYAVSLNIGPFAPVETVYHGIRGDRRETIVFWTTPERLEDARRTCDELPRLLEIFGRRFGEYPFFGDKLWIVHAPYLGMEHQTLIAYGSDFTDNHYGFDWLLTHELAHEWWGNKITASDWADAWLHEGFATYAEALVVLDTLGEERYLDYMHELRGRMTNKEPVIKGSQLTSMAALSNDAYIKGAWVLHMLRFLLGEETMGKILWRFADGDNPSACRFATTQDFVDLVDETTGRELDWFWKRYLETAELPKWTLARSGDRVAIAWDDPSFEMPLPVLVGDESRLIAMPGGRAEIAVDPATEVIVDPDGEVLSSNR